MVHHAVKLPRLMPVEKPQRQLWATIADNFERQNFSSHSPKNWGFPVALCGCQQGDYWQKDIIK